MPFKSESQRRWMWANHPKMARRWQKHTPKGAELPDKANTLSGDKSSGMDYPIHMKLEFSSRGALKQFLDYVRAKIAPVAPCRVTRSRTDDRTCVLHIRMPDREQGVPRHMHTHQTFIPFMEQTVKGYNGKVLRVQDSTVQNDCEPCCTGPAVQQNPNPALLAEKRVKNRRSFSLSSDEVLLQVWFPDTGKADQFHKELKNLGYRPKIAGDKKTIAVMVPREKLPDVKHLSREHRSGYSEVNRPKRVEFLFEVPDEAHIFARSAESLGFRVEEKNLRVAVHVDTLDPTVIDKLTKNSHYRGGRLIRVGATDRVIPDWAKKLQKFKSPLGALLPKKFKGLHRPGAFAFDFDVPITSGGSTVTKKDLAQAISRELGIARTRTQPVVSAVLEKIALALLNGQRVELRNFGVFEMRRRKQRVALNPQNQEVHSIKPETFYVHFRPSRKIHEPRSQVYPGRQFSYALHHAINPHSQDENAKRRLVQWEFSSDAAGKKFLHAVSDHWDAWQVLADGHRVTVDFTPYLPNMEQWCDAKASPLGGRKVPRSASMAHLGNGQYASGVHGHQVTMPPMQTPPEPSKPSSPNPTTSKISLYFEGDDLADECSLWLRTKGVRVSRPFQHSHQLTASGDKKIINAAVQKFKGSPIPPDLSGVKQENKIGMGYYFGEHQWKSAWKRTQWENKQRMTRGKKRVVYLTLGAAITGMTATTLALSGITALLGRGIDKLFRKGDRLYAEGTSDEAIAKFLAEAKKNGLIAAEVKKDELRQKIKSLAFASEKKTPEQRAEERLKKKYIKKQNKEHMSRTGLARAAVGVPALAGTWYVIHKYGHVPMVAISQAIVEYGVRAVVALDKFKKGKPFARPSRGAAGAVVQGVKVWLTPEQLSKLKPVVNKYGANIKKLGSSAAASYSMGLGPAEVVEFIFGNALAVAAGIAYLRSKGLAARRNGQKSILCKIVEKSDRVAGKIFREMDRRFEATVRIALPGTEFLPSGPLHDMLKHEHRVKLKKAQDVTKAVTSIPGKAARMVKAIPGAVKESVKRGPGAFVPRTKGEGLLAITVVFVTAGAAAAAYALLKRAGVAVKQAGDKLFVRPKDDSEAQHVEQVIKDKQGSVAAASFMAEEVASDWELQFRTKGQATRAYYALNKEYGFQLNQQIFLNVAKVEIRGLKHSEISMMAQPFMTEKDGLISNPKMLRLSNPIWETHGVHPGSPHGSYPEHDKGHTGPGPSHGPGSKSVGDAFTQMLIDFGGILAASKAYEWMTKAHIFSAQFDERGRVYVTIKNSMMQLLNAIIRAFSGRVVWKKPTMSGPLTWKSPMKPVSTATPGAKTRASRAKKVETKPKAEAKPKTPAKPRTRKSKDASYDMALPGIAAIGWWVIKDVLPYAATIIAADLVSSGILAKLKPNGEIVAQGDPEKIAKIAKKRDRKARVKKVQAAASYSLN